MVPINILNPSEVFIHHGQSINAQFNIAMLNQIVEVHPHTKIRVFADNAKYNHSTILKQWLSEHPLVVFKHIPPYLPNFNPIERLWKFMRKTVINSFYRESFDAFKAKILGFFKNIKTYETDLKTLISTKFQLFTPELLLTLFLKPFEKEYTSKFLSNTKVYSS